MVIDIERIRGILETFRRNVQAEAQANLQAAHNSRGLRIDSSLRVMPRSFSLTFDLGSYGLYIDKGVNPYPTGPSYSGTPPLDPRPNTPSPFNYQRDKPAPDGRMVNNLMDWIDSKTGMTFETEKQKRRAAYGIGINILRKGIEGSGFFSRAYIKHFEGLEDDIVEQFGISIDNFFNFILKE